MATTTFLYIFHSVFLIGTGQLNEIEAIQKKKEPWRMARYRPNSNSAERRFGTKMKREKSDNIKKYGTEISWQQRQH